MLLLALAAVVVWSLPPLGVLLACVALGMWWYERSSPGTTILTLHADRHGVRWGNHRVEVELDFFAVVVDGVRFVVVGGLSRAEHSRLSALVRADADPGSEADVPDALRRRREQRTHSGAATGGDGRYTRE